MANKPTTPAEGSGQLTLDKSLKVRLLQAIHSGVLEMGNFPELAHLRQEMNSTVHDADRLTPEERRILLYLIRKSHTHSDLTHYDRRFSLLDEAGNPVAMPDHF